MISDRPLRREEIDKVWTIDRSEIVENVYHLENNRLVLRPAYYDIRAWPPGEAELYTPILLECFDCGGWFRGLFDGETLIGAAVLEAKFIGRAKDQLQLKFLHVSRAYRGRGLGKRLFELARTEARARGAIRMYISATPSEHTIDFYRLLGCAVTGEIDSDLYALEPEDIHLECEV